MDYALTPGKTLLEPVLARAVRADEHRFEMQEARDRLRQEERMAAGAT